ncbi:MAG: hypothetical protein WBX01_13605 [Nitrososphaeraceae archaeon]
MLKAVVEDKNSDERQGETKFQKLVDAFDTLGDLLGTESDAKNKSNGIRHFYLTTTHYTIR